MKTTAINETLAGILALTCAAAVLLATAFDASAGLGPAAGDSQKAAGTSQKAAGTSAVVVSP